MAVNVTLVPAQIEVAEAATETLGVIAVVVFTDNTLAAEEPQELFAVTETLPLVPLGVTVRALVLELPVHPAGTVHV